ncbi:group III truncated hemoglobin [Gramella sp. AN32]|uniref:Group III truncated hemoglobin n=1 Tax=Christiangramia antarctica TaxID=2058158 RepID=A0ABW5X965_9FLAO|nr:group III truncated hemoglobin [Gramella sp. AN32]MCM4154731.1 globin [Gramella sp. AN32]
MQKDISNIDDIKELVDTFYAKVQQDELMAGIFNQVIEDRWPKHLEKMYTFWQTVLLGEHTYYGAPFMPHINLPVSKKHFDRWLDLFYETLDELFDGEKADEAKWRATKMAEMFQFKIAHYQQTNSKPLI